MNPQKYYKDIKKICKLSKQKEKNKILAKR